VPRPRRINLPDIVQRGNNRSATFFDGKDYRIYLGFLYEAALDHGTAIHAYVLMTNHVHLLATPTVESGLSLTMQALGRRYVSYINKAYERSGTLWEGRFKASPIDTERYCLCCYRYIELNPVRAGLAIDPVDYEWSSFSCNARGRTDQVVQPHPVYLELGCTQWERQKAYRRLFDHTLSEEKTDAFRHGTSKGLPIGSRRFREDIETRLKHRRKK
jgi:putative transposase